MAQPADGLPQKTLRRTTQPSKTRARKRGNGEGSLYRYRAGWRGALTYTDAAGVTRRMVVYALKHADARAALTKLRADLDEGRTPPPSGTVAEYLTRWQSPPGMTCGQPRRSTATG